MVEKTRVLDVCGQMAEKDNNLHTILPAYINFGRL